MVRFNQASQLGHFLSHQWTEECHQVSAAQGRPSLAISLSLCGEAQDSRSRNLPRDYSRLGQVTPIILS
jgi:hypothetical protein